MEGAEEPMGKVALGGGRDSASQGLSSSSRKAVLCSQLFKAEKPIRFTLVSDWRAHPPELWKMLACPPSAISLWAVGKDTSHSWNV